VVSYGETKASYIIYNQSPISASCRLEVNDVIHSIGIRQLTTKHSGKVTEQIGIQTKANIPPFIRETFLFVLHALC